MPADRIDPVAGPVLDAETIENLEALAEDGDDVLGELVALYLVDGARGLEETKSAFAKGDIASVARATHKLKSSSGYLGASRVAKMALEIEAMAKQGKAPSPDLVASLDREMQAAFEALRSLRPSA